MVKNEYSKLLVFFYFYWNLYTSNSLLYLQTLWIIAQEGKEDESDDDNEDEGKEETKVD